MPEPSAEEIADWARGLSDGALACRANPGGHQPIYSSVHEETLEGTRRTVYVQTYRCRNRCGCTWEQIIDKRTGQQYRLKIIYPKRGYLAPGIGRVVGDKKNIVRLELVLRRLQKQAERG